MMNIFVDWIRRNVPCIGKVLALWLSGDFKEVFDALSDRPVFDSPWGWHERIRHVEKRGGFISSAEKAVAMQQHGNLYMFKTPILFSANEKIMFADGSRGKWDGDVFINQDY